MKMRILLAALHFVAISCFSFKTTESACIPCCLAAGPILYQIAVPLVTAGATAAASAITHHFTRPSASATTSTPPPADSTPAAGALTSGEKGADRPEDLSAGDITFDSFTMAAAAARAEESEIAAQYYTRDAIKAVKNALALILDASPEIFCALASAVRTGEGAFVVLSGTPDAIPVLTAAGFLHTKADGSKVIPRPLRNIIWVLTDEVVPTFTWRTPADGLRRYKICNIKGNPKLKEITADVLVARRTPVRGVVFKNLLGGEFDQESLTRWLHSAA